MLSTLHAHKISRMFCVQLRANQNAIHLAVSTYPEDIKLISLTLKDTKNTSTSNIFSNICPSSLASRFLLFSYLPFPLYGMLRRLQRVSHPEESCNAHSAGIRQSFICLVPFFSSGQMFLSAILQTFALND